MSRRDRTLIPLLLVVLAVSAFGQDAASAPSGNAMVVPIRHVVFGGGFVNTLSWCALFATQVLVLPAAAMVIRNHPRATDLLPGGAGVALLLGVLGCVLGIVKSFATLAGEAGAAKMQILCLAVSGSLWPTAFGILIAIQFLLLLAVALQLPDKGAST